MVGSAEIRPMGRFFGFQSKRTGPGNVKILLDGGDNDDDDDDEHNNEDDDKYKEGKREAEGQLKVSHSEEQAERCS